MNVVVLAGGEVQPKEPLYKVTHGGLKAMIDVGGKAMVQSVLDTLSAVERIQRVIVVGLPQETLLECGKPLTLIEDQGDLLSNSQAGASEVNRQDPSAVHLLLIAADVPAIRPEMVEWLACQAADETEDICYTLIERKLMEKTFPRSKHTYIRLKDMQVCMGDVHCVRLDFILQDNPLWKRLLQARNSPLRQASLLGYDALFVLRLRQMSIKEAEANINQRLNIRGRALLSPYAELGMDVDKPDQLEILQDYLGRKHEHKQV